MGVMKNHLVAGEYTKYKDTQLQRNHSIKKKKKVYQKERCGFPFSLLATFSKESVSIHLSQNQSQ